MIESVDTSTEYLKNCRRGPEAVNYKLSTNPCLVLSSFGWSCKYFCWCEYLMSSHLIVLKHGGKVSFAVNDGQQQRLPSSLNFKIIYSYKVSLVELKCDVLIVMFINTASDLLLSDLITKCKREYGIEGRNISSNSFLSILILYRHSLILRENIVTHPATSIS